MKVLITLLFSVLSISVYSIEIRLPGESFEEAKARIANQKAKHEQQNNAEKPALPYVPNLNDLANRNLIDVYGDQALSIIDSTRKQTADSLVLPETTPRAAKTQTSGNKPGDSTSLGYISDKEYLARNNLLDIHGENATPVPRVAQTQASDKEPSPATNSGRVSHLLLPKDSVALHGILDGISRDPESSKVNNNFQANTTRANDVEDSSERVLRHLPKNHVMLHGVLDGISRDAANARDGGPSSPDGKPTSGGTFPPPPPSSSGDGSKGPASSSGGGSNMKGAPGKPTYLDANGRFWSAPKNGTLTPQKIGLVNELTPAQRDMIEDGVRDTAILSSIDRQSSDVPTEKPGLYPSDSKRKSDGFTYSNDLHAEEWQSAPKGSTWEEVADLRQNQGKQFILTGFEAADDARSLLESMNPNSAAARRLRCQLSFWD